MEESIVSKSERTLSEGQITFSGALNLIDSDDCVRFDIRCTLLQRRSKKLIFYSDCLEDDDDLTVEQFITTTDNYGSFFLMIRYKDDEFKTFQIVDDKTFEPL